MTRSITRLFALVALAAAPACTGQDAPSAPRASGYVEATEVRVASRVPGRVAEVRADEGQRVAAGDILVVLSTREIDLALDRARSERDQAVARLRLLQAGAREEDIRQAEAQLASTESERDAARADLDAARGDEERFTRLVRSRAGTEKARDDAVARRELAEARLAAAEDRVRAAEAALARLRAGARPEEITGARALVAAADAQIATLEHDRDEAVVTAPLSGVVATRLIEPGELLGSAQPVFLLIDLDRAWASAFVEEPLVPDLRLDGPATVVTDAGDRLPGRISFISPKAEFTPRNVQTAEERAKLVYRVKVTVDNREGVLKPGMPVEVEFGGQG